MGKIDRGEPREVALLLKPIILRMPAPAAGSILMQGELLSSVSRVMQVRGGWVNDLITSCYSYCMLGL